MDIENHGLRRRKNSGEIIILKNQYVQQIREVMKMCIKELYDFFVTIALGVYLSYIGSEFFERVFEFLEHHFLH